MRKLISSKKCATYYDCPEAETRKICHCRKRNKQPKKPPKQTIHPIWTLRNDSSNVAALLRPEEYLQSPRNPYTLSSKPYKPDATQQKGAFKKCCMGGNTCYCRETNKIKPTLISKPSICLAAENAGLPCAFKSCLCRDKELIKQHREELGSKCSFLKYSRQRGDYEAYRGEEEGRDELDEMYRIQEMEERQKREMKDESISTLLGTKTMDSQTASTDLDNLSKFRKDHYFDTHSTDDLSRDIPDHVCVHQYQLDDRLLPEPTNVDPYGRSRCSVCSNPREAREGSVLSTDAYRDVFFQDGDSQVELKLDKKDLERFGGFVGRFRRPQYFNTLALRQQKMLRHERRRTSNIFDVYY